MIIVKCNAKVWFASGLHPAVSLAGQSLVGGLSALVCAAALLGMSTRALAVERQRLHGCVPVAVHGLRALERLPGTNRLDFVIVLPLRNRAALTGLVERLYDPASPDYHRYLSPGQFAERFGPTPQDYEAVMAFAKANGLKITATHPNRTVVNVSGAVEDIEKTFQVKLHLYEHPTEARAFYAPDAEPSLALAVPVLAISGLDNFLLPHPARGEALSFQRASEAAPNAEPCATGAGPRGSFIGRDFRAAYAEGVSLDGAGQAAGLLEFDGYYLSDVFAYEKLAGLPDVPLTNVLVDGFSGLPGTNNNEVALDIDMAVSMAPGLSKVILYEASLTANPYDLLNRMATDTNSLGRPAATQLSSSWGWPGVPTSGEDQIFLQFAAQGQSFFQASGDLGAYCGTCPPDAPVDSPYITLVGGTLLTTISPGGGWLSETAWSRGGGGISATYPIPTWQQGVDMSSNGGSTAMRNSPDVACLADQAIWVIVNNGEQGVTGGTSAAAPLWAGFAALVNQQAVADGKPSIGFINPAIYAIGNSSGSASAFHDITTGNNTDTCCGTNKFLACPGYDLATGWGTPNGNNLVSALLAPPASLRITPATPLAFTGPFGGPFQPAGQGFVLTNDSNAPLTWTVANSAPWLNVSPTEGTLTNGGLPGQVAVTPSPVASSLPVGSYFATLWFTNVNSTNLNDRLGQSRQVSLDIVAPPVVAPDAALTTVHSFTGGSDGGNPNGLLRVADGTLYGATQNGGTNFAGGVFELTSGGTVMGLYSFTGGDDGATPFAALTQGPDANLYGTTFHGGAYDNGTVFRISAIGVLTNLVPFSITNGDLPYAALTLGADANFYGTTYQGGAGGRGTAFRMSNSGVLITLYSFTNGLDGGHVAAGLAQGRDGSYYGTTYKGGAFGFGTVFRIATNGSLTSLASFNQTNGAFPLAGLVQDPGGTLYGATSSGGAYNGGTVFALTPGDGITNLYSFTGGSDGSYPAATLLQAGDGNFYGTTAYGSAYGDGTVFRMAPDGTVTTLVAFDGFAGANPQAALIEDADASLLGTTQNGGASDAGVIFRLSFGGPPQITGQPASQSAYVGDSVVLSVAVSGASPFSYQWCQNGTNLVDAGNISGSTNRVLKLTNLTTNNAGTYSLLVSNAAGSTNSAGAVLQVVSSSPVIVSAPANQTPDHCSTVSFNVAVVGNQPLSYQWLKNGVSLSDSCNISGSATATLVVSTVTEADNGTYAVIVSNAIGSATAAAVLTVVPQSAPCTSLSTLHWFTGGDDGRTANGLAQGTNGILYGTTYSGGAYPWGTVFSLTTNGAFATLVSFMETNGANPTAAPVQGMDGKFYGTTSYGGAFGAGTVFAMTADALLSTLYSFTGDGDGANPSGQLVQAADGSFYGATRAGGMSDYGTVFRITPDGTFTNLHSFSGADGMFPSGGLAQGCDGSVYGLTTEGGASDKGTVFRITPTGAFTTLYSFAGGTDGYTPVGALVRGSDGNFYGATKHSTLRGVELFGTVFTITPNGVLTTLHTFGDLALEDGFYPYAGVVQSVDGNLYGTTYTDPVGGYGTLFRVSSDGSSFATLVYFDGCNDGAQPQAALTEDAVGDLYGTTAAGGPCQAGEGTLFRLKSGCSPQITAQPASQAVVSRANVVLDVGVTGARPFGYQWQKNGTNVAQDANLAGSTNRTLTLANVSLADAGTYSLEVTNTLGSVSSAGAHLTVVFPPVFLSAVGSNCTLTMKWSSAAGQSYRLQYKPYLAANNWNYLGGFISATGAVVTASDDLCTNAQRFYRVVLFPQIQ